MADNLFVPTEKPMKLEYPELGTMAEFSNLPERELRFVWFYANPSSPYFKVKDKKERLYLAYGESYGEVREGHKKTILAGIFTPEVSDAIDRMQRFSVSDRGRAKRMVDQVFENFEHIITEVDISVLVSSPELMAKYTDVALKISDALPDLIKKKEEGFGIKGKAAKVDPNKKTMNLMDGIVSSESNV